MNRLAAGLFLGIFFLAGAMPAIDRQLPMKLYTTLDGLAFDTVMHILPDSRGFLWFSTEDGVSRFDGSKFVNFGAEQGLPYPVVNNMLEGPGGVYWIVTNGGLAQFDTTSTPARVGKVNLGLQAAANRMNLLYRSRAGVLWLGTDGGVFTISEVKGQPAARRVGLGLPSHPDLLVQVWAFAEDAEGSMWIGTSCGLVRLLPKGGIVQYSIQPGMSSDHVLSLIIDRKGTLWIGHQSGLFLFRPQPAGSSSPGLPSSAVVQDQTLQCAKTGRQTCSTQRARFIALGRVMGLHEFSDGRVWIACGPGGLYEFDGDQYHAINAGRQGIEDLNGPIAEDRDGNVWLGTATYGAIRVSPWGFVTYGKAEGLSSGPAMGMLEDNLGNFVAFIGALQLSCFDGQRFSSFSFAALRHGGIAEPWPSAHSLLRDHLGEWWAGTRHGLYRFPRVDDGRRLSAAQPKAIYTAKDGLAENQATSLFEDSRGDLWISSFAPAHDVLTRWNRSTGTFIRYSDRDGLPAFRQPTSISEDRAGDLWISFREGGLARYRAGRFRYFGASDGFPDGQIFQCYVDRADRLWCSNVLKGLLRMDRRGEGRLDPVIYSTREGLAPNLTLAIGEDLEGRIYAGNAQGVDQIDPVTNRIRHFSVNDGLTGGRLLQVFRDHTGALWFSGRSGVSRLAPGRTRRIEPSPVLIAGVHIAGVEGRVSPLGVREMSLGDLPAQMNSLQIDYLRVSFASGDPLRFEYKLEGAGADWSEPTTLTTVNYPSLPSGSYRFLVRSVAIDGSADRTIDASPAAVSFRILPPLWRRWWVIALALLAAALALIAFERSRARRQAALRESEARYRTLAETASDAIITIDEAGEIVFVNSTAERVFGYPTAEMLGRGLAMLIPGYAWQSETGEANVEMRGKRRDGSDVPLELSFGDFIRDGRRFFTIVARDITERKRAEDALRRSREERIAELERVRKRIATDLHDDIGSSLTQISVLSEVVQQRLGGPDTTTTAPLSYIAGASRELIDSLSDIVWAINPQRDRLSDLLHRMRRFAADTFTARNIAFRLALPGDERDIRLEGNLRREVFLIFKESISNIVRHSGCSEANIELKIAGSRLELTIADNGTGFDPDRESDGHGLLSMRSRAADIGASYELVSTVGHGTWIRVGVPLPEQGAPQDYINA